jgi:hypothetical protein
MKGGCWVLVEMKVNMKCKTWVLDEVEVDMGMNEMLVTRCLDVVMGLD